MATFDWGNHCYCINERQINLRLISPTVQLTLNQRFEPTQKLLSTEKTFFFGSLNKWNLFLIFIEIYLEDWFFCLVANGINMSILMIRSLNKFCQTQQIHSILKLTSRKFGVTSIVQQKRKIQNDSDIATSNASDRTDVSTDVRPIGERIKENTKTASYFGVIVFGIGVTGVIAFVVFRELFSSSSPNNVYSDALKSCINVSLRIKFSRNGYFKIISFF